MAKTLVWSPYLYESDAPRLLGQFLLGLLPLVALTAWASVRRRVIPPLEWRVLATWVVPYALVGVLFFGSDSERWLFILPVAILLAAPLVALEPHRDRLFTVVVGYLFVLNLVTAVWPAHRDAQGIRSRAETAARLFSDGDLIVFPGHSWDEYVSFYATAKLEPFPLAYYIARDGAAAGWARLERDVRRALDRGGHVFVLRVWDDHDLDPRGIDELTALGYDRATLRRELEQRFSRVTLGAFSDSGIGEVDRLDPRPTP
jgi:hypothetical protein